MSFDIDEDSIPAIRGWVTKQGGSHKSWKKRWFQTTPRNPFRLDYYTNDSCSSLKGHIDMSQVTDMITTRNKDKDGSMRYGFQLVTEKRTWKLIVEGEEDGEYWKDSFRKLINQVRKSKGLPPLERKKHDTGKRHHHHHDKKKEEKKKTTTTSSTPVTPVNAAPPPPTPITVTTTSNPTTEPEQQEDSEKQQEEEQYDQQDEQYDQQDEQYDQEEEGEYSDEEYDEDDDIAPEEIYDNEIRACVPPEKYAVALHDYDSSTETELSIKRGQKIIIFDDSDPEGWLGAETIDGSRGWVSSHYVKILL
ncbi:variant sh3 domain containing protein [Entamoeba histolytica HM-3:IMSS]|uniref:Variant sh3 domain containing protein n=1 Tax=Entamoeba histolytica HM-3:IMSS TaxID=885315 RepID=M7W6P3_ENTHI|nr:variant sh3 domain containing protein [Entamoeba histolytica HM-3:IMSS]